jgi:hypothetical protein
MNDDRIATRDALAAALTVCQQELAECYRLTGADPDGNTDAALAPYAVAEVKRMREELEQEIDRVERVAKMCGEAADRQAQKYQEAVAALGDLRSRLHEYVKHKIDCKRGRVIEPVECPACGVRMLRVRNTSGYLNDDQFDAVKVGDWFCKRHDETAYRWDRDLVKHDCTCGLAALLGDTA